MLKTSFVPDQTAGIVKLVHMASSPPLHAMTILANFRARQLATINAEPLI